MRAAPGLVLALALLLAPAAAAGPVGCAPVYDVCEDGAGGHARCIQLLVCEESRGASCEEPGASGRHATHTGTAPFEGVGVVDACDDGARERTTYVVLPILVGRSSLLEWRTWSGSEEGTWILVTGGTVQYRADAGGCTTWIAGLPFACAADPPGQPDARWGELLP
ncbi:MAG TPA: hypothetical protein VM370_04950 [Candidatus Thermoplasmatota archaeon]|nr:hypothetical protein [Candidatus Thermoplasmatota archaeon]